jgi:hypothetical protein
MDEEHRNALLLYVLIGAVVVFALGLIAYGYYKDRIAPNHETVLVVGDRKFDMAFLQRRIEGNFNLGTSPPSATLQDLVIQTLQAIELEEVTRQAGRESGLAVTAEDIENEIKTRLGLGSDIARNDFAARYRSDVLKTGLPLGEYREIIEAQVVQKRLQEQYQAAVPAQADQVDARLIRTSAESRALEAKQKLDSGQAFNLTAIQYSIDQSKETGGELGWVTRDEVGRKIAETLFTIPLGQVSSPFQDRGGWYLVQAGGREVRDIDTAQKSRISAAMFATIISDTRDKIGSNSKLTEDQIVRLGKKILG